MIIDVALWLFRGVTLLGYTEKEVFRMSIRKLNALFEKYCEWNGLKTKEKISEVFPNLR